MRNNDTYAPGQDGLKPLKRLYQHRNLKHLKGLNKGLRSLGGPIKFIEKLPDALLGAIDGVVHLDDPDVQDLLSRLDTRSQADEQMARRVVNLKRTKFTGAPYTELIVYDWFTRNGTQFDYQVPLNGGRKTMYGQVLDFAFYTGGTATAMPVQGDYWHSRPAISASDQLDKLMALGQLVNGYRIEKYVPVWEHWLYKDRNQVLSYALANVELPR